MSGEEEVGRKGVGKLRLGLRGLRRDRSSQSLVDSGRRSRGGTASSEDNSDGELSVGSPRGGGEDQKVEIRGAFRRAPSMFSPRVRDAGVQDKVAFDERMRKIFGARLQRMVPLEHQLAWEEPDSEVSTPAVTNPGSGLPSARSLPLLSASSDGIQRIGGGSEDEVIRTPALPTIPLQDAVSTSPAVSARASSSSESADKARPSLQRSKSGRIRNAMRRIAHGGGSEPSSHTSPQKESSPPITTASMSGVGSLSVPPLGSTQSSSTNGGSSSGGEEASPALTPSSSGAAVDGMSEIRSAVALSMARFLGDPMVTVAERLTDTLVEMVGVGGGSSDSSPFLSSKAYPGMIQDALLLVYGDEKLTNFRQLLFSPLVSVPLDSMDDYFSPRAGSTMASSTLAMSRGSTTDALPSIHVQEPPAGLSRTSAGFVSMPTISSGDSIQRLPSHSASPSPTGGGGSSSTSSSQQQDEKMRLAREKLMALMSKAPSSSEKSSLAGIYQTDDGEFVRKRDTRLPIDPEYIRSEAVYAQYEKECEGRNQRAFFRYDADFRLETGSALASSLFNECCRMGLKEMDVDQLYYKQYFQGVAHQNFVAELTNGEGYAVVSVEKPSKNKPSRMRKVLLRYPRAILRSLLPSAGRMTGRETIEALRQHQPILRDARILQIKDDAELETELLNFESKLGMREYKFGVLYAAEGQADEAAMFGNEHGSAAFDAFLALLGERITLNGWKGFRGGLDVNNHSTGKESVFTKFQDLSIMFHVSTLLPYVAGDEQQLERKRHLGNDIVVLVFQEGNEPLPPFLILCEFIHTYVVVRRLQGKDGAPDHYAVAVCDRNDVSPYGPLVPKEHLFLLDDELRRFVLVKMLNAERSAYFSAAAFSQKLTRTRDIMLRAIAQPRL